MNDAPEAVVQPNTSTPKTQTADPSSQSKGKGASRRAFLSQVGGVAAATIAGGAALAGPLAAAATAQQNNG